jgi:hypothetical protein
MRKLLIGATAMAVAAGITLLPGAANAWWRHGFYGPGVVFIGPPIYAPPPIYYGPPVIYAPPPVYAAPMAGSTCYAGAYICPLDQPAPMGGECSCPTNQGRAYGRAR